MKKSFLITLLMVAASVGVQAQGLKLNLNGVNYETLTDSTAKVANCAAYGDVIVSGHVKIKRKIYKVVEIAPQAFAANSVGVGVSTVTLPETLEKIGESAFKEAPLTKIEIPSSVTEIGDMAFYNCKSLADVKLSTSLKTIGYSVFSGCSALQNVVIPSSVTSIGELAFEASGLQSVTVPNSVTSIGAGAFYHCSSLETVVVPNSVKKLGSNCFQYCDKLKSLTLPDAEPERLYPSKENFLSSSTDYSYGFKGSSLVEIKGNASASCPQFAVKDILSLTKEYAEYPYVSSPFAKNNLRRIVKSFSYVAHDQVNSRMADWQKKKEYETPEQWRSRVTVENRSKKLKEVIDEVRKNYIASLTRSQVTGTLGAYDTDYGTYPVKIEGMGTVYAKVAPEEAEEFKNYWNSVVVLPEYGVKDDQVAILSCTFRLGDKTYQTATSYTNDNSDEFLANLPPLDVNLGGAKEAAVVVDNSLDIDVPEVVATNTKTFAVIIGNENYQRVTKVNYALNDAKTFATYCEKTLGIPVSNIRSYTDATYGTMLSALDDIKSIGSAYNGDLNVIFYYAGHGVPNEAEKNAYLLPIDADGQHTEVCLSTKRLYDTLNQLNAHQVIVFMDACFSGAQRGEGMLASARGVALKAKADVPQGNTIVFSAATGDETAYPYKEKGHGLFTYYLLKKLQETKGDVTLGELGNYVNQEVRKQSVVINHKSQTPTVIPSVGMQGWESMKLR